MNRLKLVDLLKTFLTEYPGNDCIAVTQDGDGNIYYWRATPTFNDDQDSWEAAVGRTANLLCEKVYFAADADRKALEFEACPDYDSTIVTRAMFETALVKPTGDLREWRDRIIEIRAMQNSLKDELNTLIANIKDEGFEINVNLLPRR